MYQYIKHKDINFKLWDECIEASPNGIIYALSWYLNITAPGWEAIVKVENGKYAVVMPVPVFKKFGIKYVKQPILSQQLGIFANKLTIANQEVKEILSLLGDKLLYVQHYELNTKNLFLFNLNEKEYFVKKFHTYHINLNKGYQEIYSQYSTNRKRDIKKGKTNRLSVHPSNNIELLVELFKKNVAPKIYGINGKEYDVLRSIHRQTRKRELSFLLEVRGIDNDVLGMALFLKYNSKIIYLFNAVSLEGRRKGAISFMIDHVLGSNANQHLHFDFESPEISQLAEFYKSFGSVAISYPSISFDHLPAVIKKVKSVRMLFYRKFINSPRNHE